MPRVDRDQRERAQGRGVIVIDLGGAHGVGDAGALEAAGDERCDGAIARVGEGFEIAAILDVPLRPISYSVVEEGAPIDGAVRVTIHEPALNPRFTFTLLQSIPVLATGSRVDADTRDPDGQPRSYTTITLDTSPEDAKRVIAAREIGRVTALLRAPGDITPVSTAITDGRKLLGLPDGDGKGISSVPVIYGGGPITSGLKMSSHAETPLD